ncbi:MAG: CRISPR-associated protein Cas5d [Thermoanaerobaculia bacterium]|nr:CRISPR-associated protein Cas5d [Thermoanaerobaculia bacterium]
MLRSSPLSLRVTGPMACFTNPALKVERFSYDVMTPSAARGVLEAVCWKPAIVWRIDRIKVLKPINRIAIRRNEVNSRLSTDGAISWMQGDSSPTDFFADEDRAQRNMVGLRDVDYVIEAHFEMTPKAGPGDNVRKFEEMFRRRVSNGQCFQTPYLGCRELVAEFSPADGHPAPIPETRPLGRMLHDIEFSAGGSHRPVFFDAALDAGVLAVPPWKEVRE